ncbi:hypothetical protein OG2516_04259 [Oceanicola granulosus HTCC2516]|uniref:DUF3168 domain-containing protein n=1 Tax=Oceanicola granulosus (strain ATCC BAA-861 / DSM 15982 / KCTC 12143 / HTCC2516) TaxID=314256 RepID=Q2CEB7_OCEGH|nr:DUF3168 domain-containing protein [Oceanicola granulosus]EAR51080.1 hypothetical protein OG2516_04259 [Oceanicola granulosus HTCC2516]
MSYGVSGALQAAVFQALATDAALAAEVGTAIYDALPPGSLPPLYVTLGPEQAEDRSDVTATGALHEFTVSVVSHQAGFAAAKAAAAAISDALAGADLLLARGRLVWLAFHKARAARAGTGDTRRIDLRFRARVED